MHFAASGGLVIDWTQMPTYNTIMAVVKGDMADGGYTASWQTAAADGHPEKGTFAFILKHPAAPTQ